MLPRLQVNMKSKERLEANLRDSVEFSMALAILHYSPGQVAGAGTELWISG
jgi:hypothetical protein